MVLSSKIKLSWRFGKVTYLISALLTISMAVVVVTSPFLAPACILIKLLSIPIIYYLNLEMTKGMGIYFYLNLGISRREFHFLPFAVESVPFVILMIISCVIGYAIG